MEQTREPIFTPDAGKLVGKAVGLTQAALRPTPEKRSGASSRRGRTA